MNQNSEFRSNRMKENDPTNNENYKPNDQISNYSDHSNARNLIFEWPDGKMEFLNYAYLIHCKFSIDGDIILQFTSHMVTLKGTKLLDLFEDFTKHLPNRIVCSNKRYNSILNAEIPLVNEIISEKL